MVEVIVTHDKIPQFQFLKVMSGEESVDSLDQNGEVNFDWYTENEVQNYPQENSKRKRSNDANINNSKVPKSDGTQEEKEDHEEGNSENNNEESEEDDDEAKKQNQNAKRNSKRKTANKKQPATPSKAAKTADSFRRRWTKQEDIHVLLSKEEGKTFEDIGISIDRTGRAVQNRLHVIQKDKTGTVGDTDTDGDADTDDNTGTGGNTGTGSNTENAVAYSTVGNNTGTVVNYSTIDNNTGTGGNTGNAVASSTDTVSTFAHSAGILGYLSNIHRKIVRDYLLNQSTSLQKTDDRPKYTYNSFSDDEECRYFRGGASIYVEELGLNSWVHLCTSITKKFVDFVTGSCNGNHEWNINTEQEDLKTVISEFNKKVKKNGFYIGFETVRSVKVLSMKFRTQFLRPVLEEYLKYLGLIIFSITFIVEIALCWSTKRESRMTFLGNFTFISVIMVILFSILLHMTAPEYVVGMSILFSVNDEEERQKVWEDLPNLFIVADGEEGEKYEELQEEKYFRLENDSSRPKIRPYSFERMVKLFLKCKDTANRFTLFNFFDRLNGGRRDNMIKDVSKAMKKRDRNELKYDTRKNTIREFAYS